MRARKSSRPRRSASTDRCSSTTATNCAQVTVLVCGYAARPNLRPVRIDGVSSSGSLGGCLGVESRVTALPLDGIGVGDGLVGLPRVPSRRSATLATATSLAVLGGCLTCEPLCPTRVAVRFFFKLSYRSNVISSMPASAAPARVAAAESSSTADTPSQEPPRLDTGSKTNVKPPAFTGRLALTVRK